MEAYGQGYGYIAYQTTLNRDYDNVALTFESLGDRAQIYINKKLVGIIYINDEELKAYVTAKAGDTLTILCENMGRANFGPKMMRKKGIVGRCLLGGKIHFDWNVYPLEMNNLELVDYSTTKPKEESCFYRGRFNVDKCADTFLRLDNFKKGFVVINGFNIGRYWEIGPQKSLYVPKSILKEGENEIVVFESDGRKGLPEIEFFDYPTLG
jgi:beta-galactosidase